MNLFIGYVRFESLPGLIPLIHGFNDGYSISNRLKSVNFPNHFQMVWTYLSYEFIHRIRSFRVHSRINFPTYPWIQIQGYSISNRLKSVNFPNHFKWFELIYLMNLFIGYVCIVSIPGLISPLIHGFKSKDTRFQTDWNRLIWNRLIFPTISNGLNLSILWIYS